MLRRSVAPSHKPSFGAENFVVTLLIKKTGSQKGSLVQSISDYLIWFAKSKTAAETYCTKLYQAQTLEDLLNDNFNIVEFPDGDRKSVV